jgi:hypothetical protein
MSRQTSHTSTLSNVSSGASSPRKDEEHHLTAITIPAPPPMTKHSHSHSHSHHHSRTKSLLDAVLEVVSGQDKAEPSTEEKCSDEDKAPTGEKVIEDKGYAVSDAQNGDDMGRRNPAVRRKPRHDSMSSTSSSSSSISSQSGSESESESEKSDDDDDEDDEDEKARKTSLGAGVEKISRHK